MNAVKTHAPSAISNSDAPVVLAGDIGGTSARLAFFEVRAGSLVSLAEHTYPSRQYGALENIALEFASTAGIKAQRACFGLPGPVRDGRVVTSNLAWTVDASVMARALDLPSVTLLNDLEANAHGIACLGRGEYAALNPGASGAQGHLAVISAGTGLGEAGVFWDGREHWPFATEGGHADFAPRNDLEAELLRHLRARFGGHVSVERVLSGPGLANIYDFLRDSRQGASSSALDLELAAKDPAAAISAAALAGADPLCVQALDLFVSIYGAEAGNLALKTMALGGVYIGGGIAPKIIEKLREPLFMEAFLDKGRLRRVLEDIPVRVILNPKTALLGAARCAAFPVGGPG